jgi:hypothetical protein
MLLNLGNFLSRSSLVLDAVVEAATSTAASIRSEDARSDLERFVVHTFRSAGSPPLRQLLRLCVAEAVRDNEADLALQRFAAERRAALRAIIDRGVESGDFQSRADADLLVEQVYGLLWYRLLDEQRADWRPRGATDCRPTSGATRASIRPLAGRLAAYRLRRPDPCTIGDRARNPESRQLNAHHLRHCGCSGVTRAVCLSAVMTVRPVLRVACSGRLPEARAACTELIQSHPAGWHRVPADIYAQGRSETLKNRTCAMAEEGGKRLASVVEQ